MCLLPAAIVLVGLSFVTTLDEWRKGEDASTEIGGSILWATFIFAVLGIICR
jgi:TRAP-type mannitol/chloroaromatic compound transport system permease small subunit